MLIQRSTQLPMSEYEEKVPLAKLNWNQKKRKKNGEEVLELEDKWKSEEETKRHYRKFKFDGREYELEDSVLIIPASPNRKLYIAIIKDIYKQGKEDYVFLQVQWFYRLEDAEKKAGGNWESKDSRVLFYSFHREEMFAEFVRHKCVVHFVPGNMQIPKPRQHPGFIVQNVYDFVNKKLWKLTDEDFDEMQKREIDLLVAKTVSRLGDLLDIDKEQKTTKFSMK